MNIEAILKEAGAWHEGHTVFKNGLHSNGWIEKNAVLKNPVYLDKITLLQAEQIKNDFPDAEMFLGAITGGAILVSHIVRHFYKPWGIILGKEKPIQFHSINVPEKGTKVVLVEDNISSGIDMNDFLEFLLGSGVEVLGVNVWVNRQAKVIRGIKIHSLMPAPFELYEASECPLCAKDIEVKYENIRE